MVSENIINTMRLFFSCICFILAIKNIFISASHSKNLFIFILKQMSVYIKTTFKTLCAVNNMKNTTI